MLEDLSYALREVSVRSARTGAILVEAQGTADQEGVQQAIASVQMQMPQMPQLVHVRPMYDDPEKAKQAGLDPSIDDVESLLENAFEYAILEPLRKSGIPGSE